MMKNASAMMLAALLAGGCSGPLISERLDGGVSPSDGLAHGSYCLPKIILEVTVTQNSPAANAAMAERPEAKIGDYETTVARVHPIIVPDPSRLYRLGFLGSVLSDDKITVEYEGFVNEAGSPRQLKYPASCLLSRVATETEDKSPQIVRDLATVALRGASGSPQAKLRGGVETATRVVQLILDVGPQTLRAEQDRLNAALRARSFTVSVSIRPLEGAAHRQSSAEQTSAEGIFFLTPKLYVLTLHQGIDPEKDPPFAETTFYSASGLSPQFVSIDRSAFVKRTTTMHFDRGFPLKIETNKPSEAVGFMAIPLDVSEAILSVPGATLQRKTTDADLQAKHLAGQATVIKRQRELIEEQNKLIELLEKKKPQASKAAEEKTADPGDEIPGADETEP